MATLACKSAIRENKVDTFRPLDFGKNLILSPGQVVGVLDIENAGLQLALNQPIHLVQRVDVMVVRFPEWRNGESSAKVYDSTYVSRRRNHRTPSTAYALLRRKNVHRTSFHS
jgi:hypothetical protein